MKREFYGLLVRPMEIDVKNTIYWIMGWDHDEYVSDAAPLETAVDACENRGYGPLVVHEYHNDGTQPKGKGIGKAIKHIMPKPGN